MARRFRASVKAGEGRKRPRSSRFIPLILKRLRVLDRSQAPLGICQPYRGSEDLAWRQASNPSGDDLSHDPLASAARRSREIDPRLRPTALPTVEAPSSLADCPGDAFPHPVPGGSAWGIPSRASIRWALPTMAAWNWIDYPRLLSQGGTHAPSRVRSPPSLNSSPHSPLRLPDSNPDDSTPAGLGIAELLVPPSQRMLIKPSGVNNGRAVRAPPQVPERPRFGAGKNRSRSVLFAMLPSASLRMQPPRLQSVTMRAPPSGSIC
jgi:hypothetical protein